MSAVGIIPARYRASRFPGKPLTQIAGRPMLHHVIEGARRAKRLREVWVATDDERIAEAAAALGAPVAMTSPEHPTGTDRLAEAAASLPDAVVVNIQGDEPLIEGFVIDAAVEALEADAEAPIATVVHRLEPAALADPNRVKVVLDRAGCALYFSRAPIPYRRADAAAPSYFQHVGLYAYRRECVAALRHARAGGGRARRGPRAAARARARPRDPLRRDRGLAERAGGRAGRRRARRGPAGAPVKTDGARAPGPTRLGAGAGLGPACRSRSPAPCSCSRAPARWWWRPPGCAGCACSSARRRRRSRPRWSPSSAARRSAPGWRAARRRAGGDRFVCMASSSAARPSRAWPCRRCSPLAEALARPVLRRAARVARRCSRRCAPPSRSRATLPAAACFGATYPALASAALGTSAALGSRGALLYGVNTLGAALGLWLASFVLPERDRRHGRPRRRCRLPRAGRRRRAGREPRPPRVETPRAPSPGAERLAGPSGAPRRARGALGLRLLRRPGAADPGLRACAQPVGLCLRQRRPRDAARARRGALLVSALGARAASRSEDAARRRARRRRARLCRLPRGVLRGDGGPPLPRGAREPWPALRLRGLPPGGRDGRPRAARAGLVLPATLALAGRGAPAAPPGQIAGRLLGLRTRRRAARRARRALPVCCPHSGSGSRFASVGACTPGRGVPGASGRADAPPAAGPRARRRRLLAISRGSPLALPPLRLEPGQSCSPPSRPRPGWWRCSSARAGAAPGRQPLRARRQRADAVHQERQAHLPLLLHPARARRVAFLGSATGISAGAALAHASVERLALVELVPGVAEAARALVRGREPRRVRRREERGACSTTRATSVRATAARFDVIVARPVRPLAGGRRRRSTRASTSPPCAIASRRAACSASGCRSIS